jgi:LmbE family N-acetylglucosaminyl deacetylase
MVDSTWPNNYGRVLIVAAHPDDEVLGCGGTMARLAQAGSEVYVAILGEGITSRYDRREQASQALVDRLRVLTRTVAAGLGVKEVFTFDLPDNRFDTVPLLDIVKLVEEVVGKVRPAAVYTQHGGDLNMDHVVTHRATLTATRPTAECPVKAVYAYEVASSSEWAFQQFAPVFRPNVFVDISSTLEAKIQAMQAYESEARPFPHPRSPEALRAAAMRWGTVVGVGAAEAFQCIREVQ